MQIRFFILSGLLFLSLGSFGQIFEIVLNQPDLLSVSAGNDTLICKNHSVVLGDNPTASGGTEDYIYMWSPLSGLDDPTSPNPIASPLESTKYLLTVTDDNGCHIMDFVNVNIDPCLGIGYEDLLGDVAIYPNPSYGEFTVTGLPFKGQKIKISLINGMGSEIMSRLLHGGTDTIEFNLSEFGFPKGFYFFRIETGTEVLIRKIQLI